MSHIIFIYQGAEVTVPINADIWQVEVTITPTDPDMPVSAFLTVKGCFEEGKSKLLNLEYVSILISINN